MKHALLMQQIERLPNGTAIKVTVQDAVISVQLTAAQAIGLLVNESPAWEIIIRQDEGMYGLPVLDVWLVVGMHVAL